jgi:hypothetical protein
MSTYIFIIVHIVRELALTPSDPPILTKHLLQAYSDVTDARNCMAYEATSIVNASKGATRLNIADQDAWGSFLFEGGEYHDHGLHIERVLREKEWVEPKEGISDGWLKMEKPKKKSRKIRWWLWRGRRRRVE